jgi:hypothetical protein
MRRMRIGLVVAAVCAGALVGCGGGDDGGDGGGDHQLTARQTAKAYVDGQNARDFVRVCAVLGDPLRQQLGGDNCVNFLREQTSGGPHHTYTLTNVGASGDLGTAYIVTTGETGKPVKLSLLMQRRDGVWKIVGSGPTAPPGKPAPND